MSILLEANRAWNVFYQSHAYNILIWASLTFLAENPRWLHHSTPVTLFTLSTCHLLIYSHQIVKNDLFDFAISTLTLLKLNDRFKNASFIG
jgi:hypothetical protein